MEENKVNKIMKNITNGDKVKCPMCQEEITLLKWSENAVRFGNFYGENKHNMAYETDSVESAGNDEFMCPDCDEVLFINEKDAIKFLNGDN